MMVRPLAAALGAGAVLLAGYWVWHGCFRGEDAIIRERLDALVASLNEGSTEGLGVVTRAARIGSFFTDDVVVDPGEGDPVRGRETVMGMAARLQRTGSPFSLALDDVTVGSTEGGSADVNLTATFTSQAAEGSESSIDAREFELVMRKVEGEWLIARVTAVEAMHKR